MNDRAMKAAATETDDELLLRIQSGDEQAFLDLYRRRQAALFRFALHMSGSNSVAEDVTQEVFLALLREGCGFDPERGTLSGYLFGIARKLVLRHLERGRSDVVLVVENDDSTLPELAVIDDPMVDLTRREGIDALRRAVQALPRRYREVVVLCDLEEVDYADAAIALGCPIGTVRSRLHRARGLLLEKLNQERNPRQAISLKPVRCAS
ncbi:MAG: polymerase, sigma-24 subunit, subfamily [Candidatus Solibacter sp.]|jgi:RNA polymerase sigma-70 factor (ECF subfamily)|nr:polymerase, sigma-24 subunit, subfamily [Candidatus Solibacter sp.]